MKSKISKIILLLSIICSLFFHGEVYSAHSFSALETQIDPSSSASKIIKLQKFFQKLGLYSGNIDGLYSSIEGNLISYQKKSGIISHDSDWGAGYFGIQTLESLQNDFPQAFNSSKNLLLMDTPTLGERNFYVTAYYSPLPGQSKYSYNVYTKRYRTFEEEKRLQGEGRTTASGKAVFSGILAAPKNYKFGTKIELEGIGVGVVEDRGGAIVNEGERGHDYDRIDIWMGYGDEGLARAEKWGKREVKGKIVSTTSKVTVQFDSSPIEQYTNLKVDLDSKDTENVKKLQTLLTNLNIYKGEIDGKYMSVKKSFIDFQVKNNIVQSATSDDAGYFGPKTIAYLRKNYGGKGIFIEPNTSHLALLTDEQKSKLNIINLKITKYINLKSKGNLVIKNKYKKKLKIQLTQMIENTKSQARKAELVYIVNNI